MSRLTSLARLSRVYISYLKRAEIAPHLPTRIWIEPTPSCNFHCGYCPNGMEDAKFDKGLMKMELFTRVIDELAGALNDVNLFHRGESLIHPKLNEMVRYCSDRGIKTRLHTNAGLLTGERAAKLIEAGLSYISFSVDGYTKEVYGKNRLGGDFDTTMENIRRFLAIKKEMGRGPFSIVQVMEVGEAPEGREARRSAFLENFNGLPLDRFVVRAPHNWAGDFSEYGRGVGSGRFTPCTFLWYSMTIFFDGTVAACPQDFFGKIKIGSVADSSVASVWNGDAMRAMRRRMKDRAVAGLDPCATCDMLARKTILGVPVNYLGVFIKDNLLAGKP
ncbi:MAG: radical SAM protein [Nitrospinae bacterium]|nr:radical SAM protein [Nitrospinota bacterium]